ncbi:ABC transporter permease subunit [Candidatus Saccharibacteria bacterium]|nr:ABC transporter permease subunit [Candidatus Saccharibacteria bacterium]
MQSSPKAARRHILISFVFIATILIILFILAQTGSINWPQFLYFFVSSAINVAIAYVIAAILALALALGITRSKILESLFLPILDVAQSFPTFALIPVLLVLFGRTRWVVITFLVVTIIWPIVFTLITAIKTERQDLADAATIYGAKGVSRFLHFRLPEIFPSFITGSIIGWGEAWEALIGAEIIVQIAGIGHYLNGLGASGNVLTLTLAITMYLFLIFIFNQVIWLPLLNYSSRYQND